MTEQRSASATQVKPILTEMVVITALICLPQMVISLRESYTDFQASSNLFAIGLGLIPTLSRLALVLFLMWGSGESFSKFGLKPLRPADFGWGVLLILLAVCASILVPRIPGHKSPTVPGTEEIVFFRMLISALFAEVFWHAYLITRFMDLGWTKTMAVLGSSSLFLGTFISSGLSALSVAALMFIYAIFFVRLRTIWPMVIAFSVAAIFAAVAPAISGPH